MVRTLLQPTCAALQSTTKWFSSMHADYQMVIIRAHTYEHVSACDHVYVDARMPGMGRLVRVWPSHCLRFPLAFLEVTGHHKKGFNTRVRDHQWDIDAPEPSA